MAIRLRCMYVGRGSTERKRTMTRLKAALIGVSIAAVSLQAATTYKVTGRYPVAGNGGFDYLMIDSGARRLYISHGTQVDVVDARTRKPLGTLNDTPAVHGIAIQ